MDAAADVTRQPLRVLGADERSDIDSVASSMLLAEALVDPLPDPLGPMLPPPPPRASEIDPGQRAYRARMLVLSFCVMVVVGVGNLLSQKFQTYPMHNYPNFLNLLTTAMYIPLSFAYVAPAACLGRIDAAQLRVPKRPFAVMGLLDAMAGILQVFAMTYLPGGQCNLLKQAATPVSMVLSRVLLKTTYARTQYCGAAVVGVGLATVLYPTLASSGGETDHAQGLLWSGLLLLSCVPMCLSSVYKEVALGERELDPVFLNGWIAIFQFLASLPFAVPAALVSDPPVAPHALPENLYDGLRCWLGLANAVSCDDDDGDDCVSDDCWPRAAIWVNVYLLFNVS